MSLADRSPLYAARLNAFRIGARAGQERNAVTTRDLIERAASAGLTAADLNYPDHFQDEAVAEIGGALQASGMALNGLAMRYYSLPDFKIGAFTHPDRGVRDAAIDLTRRGIDTLADMGGTLMTLWLGQDGFDYSFQMDYARAWDDTVDAIRRVCDHNPDVDIAIEYKPNEPRAFALMPDLGATLLAIREAERGNLGVTLDFAHVLYADEMPAWAAVVGARHSRLLGVHLNDGYAKRDDGLAVASVHPIQTVELLATLVSMDYEGALYFDTFPDHAGVDPVAEAKLNIEVVEQLLPIARRLAGDAALKEAISRQDAPTSLAIVQRELIADGRR